MSTNPYFTWVAQGLLAAAATGASLLVLQFALLG